MSIATKLAELDNNFIVAEQISNDLFGNARIAVLESQNINTKARVIKIVWSIYTVDVNGEVISMKGLSNPYVFQQVALSTTLVDPITGDDIRAINENESEEDYRANVLDLAISEYDFILTKVKDEGVNIFTLIRSYINEASSNNRI